MTGASQALSGGQQPADAERLGGQASQPEGQRVPTVAEAEVAGAKAAAAVAAGVVAGGPRPGVADMVEWLLGTRADEGRERQRPEDAVDAAIEEAWVDAAEQLEQQQQQQQQAEQQQQRRPRGRRPWG